MPNPSQAGGARGGIDDRGFKNPRAMVSQQQEGGTGAVLKTARTARADGVRTARGDGARTARGEMAQTARGDGADGARRRPAA